jgi:excisionase family DNA binding protein
METTEHTDLIKYRETARIFNIPVGTLYAMVHAGTIPHVRIGPRSVRFSRRTMEAWLKSKEVPCTAPRGYLAWQTIVEDADQLNLDKHHEKEANKSRDEASARVDASIKETYRLLLVPMQDPEVDGGLTSVIWEDEALVLSGANYDKAIESATRDREWVIKAWAPPHMGALLAKWFWKTDKPSVSVTRACP